MSASYIVTASGTELDLRYPDTKHILLADIAHHLAQLNRFTGACRRPYSVAEHSLLVCEIVERMLPADVHGLLAALMHDAHEAYTNDLSTPAKTEVAGWHLFEGRLQRTVLAAFALHGATARHATVIRQADLLALATERAQLLPTVTGSSLWPCLVHVQPVQWVDLMAPERLAMRWSDWRAAFEDRANELDYARNEHLYGVKQP